jgi:glutathione S-transferase
MLELYNAMQSTCSQKVRITLAEKGIDFVEHRLRLFKQDQLKPEYLKLNPNGVVPTLVHDGVPVIDSSVIMEYLDEVFPQMCLTPQEAAGRDASLDALLRRGADDGGSLPVLQCSLCPPFLRNERGRIQGGSDFQAAARQIPR